jgi:hypothetical protein
VSAALVEPSFGSVGPKAAIPPRRFRGEFRR